MSSMDAHQLIVTLKDLAIELGRTPTRDEFDNRVAGSRHKVMKAFGTYTALLQAAGLENHHPRKKERVPFMRMDLEAHLAKQQERQIVEPFEPAIRTQHTFVCLGDTHHPFCDPNALKRVYEIIEQIEPTIIIQMGDLHDMLSWSKFPASQMHFTAKGEIEKSFSDAEAMWKKIREISPKSKCYQLRGNHDLRPFKRMLEVAPALEVFIELDRFYRFEGVELIGDHREELIIDGIAFLHGYRTKLGDHANYMMHNAVVGHSHRGGVAFKHIRGKTLWELNCGYLADPSTKGLSYTPQKITDWTQGVGIIDSLGPRFVPFF
jgi:Homing endonuclease associated repeat/Calcineurin-like phosphoesterase